MNKKNQIQLEFSSILSIPFQSYTKDFTFIVNGEELQTSRIISDLLSPKISQFHLTDPTINTFVINTKNRGNFSHILELINFKLTDLSDDEYPFIMEVLEHLCNDQVKINEKDKVELTENNIIDEILKHETHHKYNSKRFDEEIEFISKIMNKLLETQEQSLMKLKIETLSKILNNEHLSISSEDDLLKFINKLYRIDPKYTILYEYVYFQNVTKESMKEFIETFDVNDMTVGFWRQLCMRLETDITNNNFERNKENRYKQKEESPKGKIFTEKENDQFSGIINYLRFQGKIDDQIEVTASSIGNSSDAYQPQTVCMKVNSNGYFYSNNNQGSWLSFDFKKHQIIPTDYTIRSANAWQNWHHLKSWVIEVSNDKIKWSIIDEVNNCSYLNGPRKVHSFKIQNIQSNAFRYIRIRQTSKNWGNGDILSLETFEIYGSLI